MDLNYSLKVQASSEGRTYTANRSVRRVRSLPAIQFWLSPLHSYFNIASLKGDAVVVVFQNKHSGSGAIINTAEIRENTPL